MRLNISPEPALLGFLLDEPKHGYDLYKQISRHLGMVWRIGMSQMYAIVNSYATRGWIRTQMHSQGVRPSRKVLALTPAGRAAFEAWLLQPARGLREFRVDFFLRLHFAQVFGEPYVRDLVDQQISVVQRELTELRARRVSPIGEETPLFQMTRDFRIQQLTTILKWLKANRGQLVRLAAAPVASEPVELTRVRRGGTRPRSLGEDAPPRAGRGGVSRKA
ncbi:MAG: PadR family transcriptional regulator [Chloroflexi bacterium]|nr:PadR family transcriptional regulator [Chloroflexota bacterium]